MFSRGRLECCGQRCSRCYSTGVRGRGDLVRILGEGVLGGVLGRNWGDNNW